MSLDYNGTPKQSFRRQLSDIVGEYSEDNITISDPVTEDEATDTFNDIARVFIKGDKIQKALAALNPAAFIPVEEMSATRTSLARLGEQQDRITFGLYKKACDFINSREDAIDEAFILNITTVDPINLNSEVVRTHKGISDSSDDWLTEFLTTLSPLAGLTIMGFLNDLAFSKSGKVPVPDGPVAGTQPSVSHLQGIGVGIALLIEAGITLIGLDILLSPVNDDASSKAVADTYAELKDSPDKRKKVLEESGYDYDSLCKNKQFDDYIAIKHYSLEYISRLVGNVQYDHWIAYANVADNQGVMKSAMGMAPMYSKKWKMFNRTGSVEALEETFFSEDSDLDIEGAIVSGLNNGLRNYFSSLLTISDDHYNKTLQAYSMMIDERMLCCMIWFLGPMDVTYLRKMTDILHILGARSTLNWKSLLTRLGEGMARSVTNMLTGYLGSLVSSIFDDVLEAMFKVPDSDWQVAIKHCIGIDFLFNLLQAAWVEIFKEVNKLVKQLNAMLNDLKYKATLSVEIAAERRYLITLSGLLRAVIDKIDYANKACPSGETLSPEALNEIAAEAAVNFVSSQITLEEYPIITLSEDLRRKFFKNVPEFTTSTLNLPVPGLDETGSQQRLSIDDKIAECGEGGRAAQGVAIGKKIAEAMSS